MKYRKKPIVIEAVPFVTGRIDEAIKFLIEAKASFTHDLRYNVIYINTLEGTMAVALGDYIIKGIKGECYPCKADIFIATYDELDPIGSLMTEMSEKKCSCGPVEVTEKPGFSRGVN